ncbi:MAG: hypothetical protein IKJ01_01765, partial [Lachnospiraceae bacterium]|nr:hypothetical protein [Lachnospiraceae bacterium]
MNRNDIISKLRLDYYSERYCFAVAYILTMINKNKILFPCLELPITTVCTLCCENCSNLMQYYEYPYILSTENVLNNLDKLVNSIDGI